jgi:hypothetical protein
MILSVPLLEVETLNMRTIGGAIPDTYELNSRVTPSARTAVRLVGKGDKVRQSRSSSQFAHGSASSPAVSITYLLCVSNRFRPFSGIRQVCCQLTYIYLYLCKFPNSNSFVVVTSSYLPQQALILLPTPHSSTYCSLKPLAKMRLTLVLSLAVLAAGIYGLALPSLSGKSSLILPKRDFLKRDIAKDAISKGNEDVEKRHENGHSGFKKSKRSPAIDFPDGGDSDGGVDNIKPPPTKISKRAPSIDFPDGGDSDGGPDNVPPPKKVIERDV